jgi:hypothetical protein
MIIGILFVVIIAYTLYIYMCEASARERFENPEDGVMVVYDYSPQDENELKYRKDPNIIKSTKQFSYVPQAILDSDDLKASDAYPIYTMIGVTKDNKVVNTISHMFTTGKGRIETDSTFIPVKMIFGFYVLMKIDADNKKYMLMADIGEARNGRAVSWYDFVDEERAKKEYSKDNNRWSIFFDIKNDGIEVIKLSDGGFVPSGWMLAVNSQNHIVLNSKEQGNKALLEMDLMIKESGEQKIVVLNDEVYIVNMERFAGVPDGVLTEHAMKSRKVILSEGMSVKDYVTKNGGNSIPYAVTNVSYPFGVKLERAGVQLINVNNPGTVLELEEIDSKYQESLKELMDNKEELMARAYFEEVEMGVEVEEKVELPDDEEIVSEMKVTKEAGPQFEGIYISGGVATSFFENVFGGRGRNNISGSIAGTNGSTSVAGELGASSLSEVQQRVLLNPAADTAKLHNREVIENQQEFNNGTCEYQLTKPQSCNQYDTPCPNPANGCYHCGKSPCACQQKEIAEKYYKPYMG